MRGIAVKTVFAYGFVLAALVAILKAIEYRFLVKNFSVDIYLGAVALIFTMLGIWVATMIRQKRRSLNKKLIGECNYSDGRRNINRKRV